MVRWQEANWWSSACECEFADHDENVWLICCELFVRGSQVDGDGQVDARPLFLHITGAMNQRGGKRNGLLR